MKDSMLLLICALGMSLLAWAILHYLGDDALSVIGAVTLISLAVDNFRLRRALVRHRGTTAK
jgi:uncharacterized membrane protein YfcA